VEQLKERVDGVRDISELSPFVENGVGNLSLVLGEDDRISVSGLDLVADRFREARCRMRQVVVFADVTPDVTSELCRFYRVPDGSLNHHVVVPALGHG